MLIFEGLIAAPLAYFAVQRNHGINSATVHVRQAKKQCMSKPSHILNAASNLLGIALLIITGLHVANRSSQTMADELAWGAAICFAVSCLLSYLAIRQEPDDSVHEARADALFLVGIVILIASVVVLAGTDFNRSIVAIGHRLSPA
jgi:amino acid permease